MITDIFLSKSQLGKLKESNNYNKKVKLVIELLQKIEGSLNYNRTIVNLSEL